MKQTAFRLVLALALAVACRAADKPPFRHTSLGIANGCFVESVVFSDVLRERLGAEAWCRVLQWGAKEDEEVVVGHAVAVFEQNGKLWCWDINHGFMALDVASDRRDDATAVATPILARYPRITAQHPLYRYDFAQTPDSSPPSVDTATAQTDSVSRDALLAGAQLARYRPVNVVSYSYVENGETRKSAATIFIFHGRFCVYFPEYGTIPFLSRLHGIRNLRAIQEALRRRHPGAQNVQPLK